MARLASQSPVRSIGTSRRALTGSVRLSGGGQVPFESSLERDWLQLLDFDDNVIAVREQPFSIQYVTDEGVRRYTPDVLVEFAGHLGRVRTVVYEVKPQDELEQSFLMLRPRFKAAVAYCRSRGWQFKIVTEKRIRTPKLGNVQFLRRYKLLPEQPEIRQQLLQALRGLERTTPEGLLAATFWHGEHKMAAIPVFWHLVANRLIGTDLAIPLNMASPIWVGQE